MIPTKILIIIQQLLDNLRTTLTAFKHSDAATYEPSKARKDLNISRGLESFGKTRFATMTITAESVRRNLPALRQVSQVPNLGIKVSHSLNKYYEAYEAHYISETDWQLI